MSAPAAARPARGLFVATILTGSFLLFLIQPMIARMALPRLGGAPNVWNSAMLVYQALLLAGYWYAHRLSRQPLARQSRLHLALYVLALLTLPVGLVEMTPPRPGSEVFWVPAFLALSIGPVFFLVSAQAPLMQRWFALHPQAGEPWPLYAASNLGSFAGLIAYPLLVEPLLPIRAQSWLWSAGYVVLLGLIALCARARKALPDPALAGAFAPDEAAAPLAPIPARKRAMWIALAAVPSGLMLSTTTHLTTDIFAMPLLWVIPLGIYLLSFVIAFAEARGPARAVSALAWPAVLGIGGLAMVSQGSNGLMPVIGAIALLFFVCVALHTRLYDLRPAPEQLTGFYLAMSLGGALGGLFTALVAPLVFDWVWEHPLLVLAAAALLPREGLLDWPRRPEIERDARLLVLVVAGGALALMVWQLYEANQVEGRDAAHWALSLGIALLGLVVVAWRPLVLWLLVMVMLVQGGLQTVKDTRDGVRTRSYFGIYTVRDYPSRQIRTLAHGTTLHGQQSTEASSRCLPLSYYGPGSGAAIGFANASRLFPQRPPRLAVLGLGTGSLTGYARPGQSWTVFEIDEAVLNLSRSGTFTFLRDCAPQAQVVLGDARINLGRVRDGTFDLLAIDAFSSDSIPLHLFTHEAFGVYLDALAPQGIMLVHISNRYIDLEPALAAEVKARGLHAAVREDDPPAGTQWTPSTWVAVVRDPAQLKALNTVAPAMAWRPLKPPAPKVWSDDHASVLPYVTWANFLGSQ